MRRLYACADALAIFSAFAAAALIAADRADRAEFLVFVALTLPVWLLVMKLYGLYDRVLKRISHSVIDDLPSIFHALLVGGLGVWAASRFVSVEQMTLFECVLFGLFSMLLIPTLRQIASGAVARRLGPERVLLVGDGPVIAPLMQILDRHPELNLEPIGMLGSAPNDAEPTLHGPRRLGSSDDLDRVITEHAPERIFVCRDAFEADQVRDLIDRCCRYSLKVGLLPDAVEAFGPAVEVDELQGIALLGIPTPVLGRTSRLLKRGFDLVIAIPTLLVCAPLLAAIAIAVRSTSPGPVVFRQSRIGRGGTRFDVFKFRTMYEDAESRREGLMSASKDPNWLLLDHDPRVTRIGGWLRRSSLDELPQLVQRGPGGDEHRRPEAASGVGGLERRRLGPVPARPDPGDHRSVAGAGQDRGSPSTRWSSSTTST